MLINSQDCQPHNYQLVANPKVGNSTPEVGGVDTSKSTSVGWYFALISLNLDHKHFLNNPFHQSFLKKTIYILKLYAHCITMLRSCMHAHFFFLCGAANSILRTYSFADVWTDENTRCKNLFKSLNSSPSSFVLRRIWRACMFLFLCGAANCLVNYPTRSHTARLPLRGKVFILVSSPAHSLPESAKNPHSRIRNCALVHGSARQMSFNRISANRFATCIWFFSG